jgi:hypothetical protein
LIKRVYILENVFTLLGVGRKYGPFTSGRGTQKRGQNIFICRGKYSLSKEL